MRIAKGGERAPLDFCIHFQQGDHTPKTLGVGGKDLLPGKRWTSRCDG